METKTNKPVIAQKTKIKFTNSCKWIGYNLTIDEIYKMASPGVDFQEAKISIRKGVLNRKVQQLEWQKDNFQRTKEFLEAVIRGNGELDVIAFVPIDLVIEGLKHEIEECDEASEKLNIEKVLLDVLEDKKNGVEFYPIDGQNRIFMAFVPFFNNEVSLPKDCTTAERVDEDTGHIVDTIRLSNKFFKDLPDDVQESIRKIEVPVCQAESGKIKDFIRALICKNSGVHWETFMMMRFENLFTHYHRQILTIVDSESEGNLLVDNVFEPLGTPFKFEKDGYEKFVSELLIWAESREQPDNSADGLNLHKKFFKGSQGCTISDTKVKQIKGYLREWAGADIKKGPNTMHMKIRNYVIFRYFLDHQADFKGKIKDTLTSNYKIVKKAEFASQFTIALGEMLKDPNAKYAYTVPGTTKLRYANEPGFLPHAQSESRPDYINDRIRLFCGWLINNENKLIQDGIIRKLDKAKVPSIEELWVKDPTDYKGNKLPAGAIVGKRSKYHAGHMGDAQALGGDNQDVKLQEKRSNWSYGKIRVEKEEASA